MAHLAACSELRAPLCLVPPKRRHWPILSQFLDRAISLIVHRVLKDLENSGAFRPGAVRLVKFAFLYLLVTHILACFYWFAATSMPNPALCGIDGHSDSIWGVCEDLERSGLLAQWACE